MNTPLAWAIDLGDVLQVRETLKRHQLCRRRPLFSVEELRNARDTLGAFVDRMANEGMDAAHEESYLHLFDALSYLTEALRKPQLHLEHFERAILELDAVFAIPY